MLFLLVGILRVGRWGIIQGQNVHTSFRENTLTDVKVGRHTHTHIHSMAFVLGKESKNGKTFSRWKWSVRFETLHISVLNTVLNVAEICSYTFGNSKTFLCIPCPAPPSHRHLCYLAVKETGHLFTRYNFSTMRILGRRNLNHAMGYNKTLGMERVGDECDHKNHAQTALKN